MGATARYTGVTVTSWDPGSGRPARNGGGRPFVEYADGSDLWAVRSTFAYLGSDRSSAYGVNWRRATGGATDSVFHHNFFGAYTYQAHGLVFRGNVFRDNLVYGLDPHTASTRLVVEHNQAFRNKVHGIVFSEDVTDGVVRANRAYANGDNGIVIDERSDRNTVSGNLVEGNEGDGIVLLGSSGILVRDNTVRGNRVGIRVNLRSGDNRVQRNQVTGNRIGIELYGGAYAVRLLANQVSGSVEKGIVLEARGRPAATTRSPGRRPASRSGPRPVSAGGRWPAPTGGSSSPSGASPPSTTPPCGPPRLGSRSGRAGWSVSAPPRSSRRPPCRGRRPGRCWPTGSPSPPARSPGWPWSASPTWWWRSPSSCCT
jgi:parallel beta-helix repeat protein